MEQKAREKIEIQLAEKILQNRKLRIDVRFWKKNAGTWCKRAVKAGKGKEN